MKPTPLLLRLLVASSAVSAPLLAQTPLFSDGTAFGGSMVFSEGLNPLANAARTAAAPAGYYLSFVDGDQRAENNKSLLASAASASPATAPGILGQLADAPWAQRTRAYGFSAIKNSAFLALTREELNGLMDYPDSTGLNPTLTGTRATVDRLSVGGGGKAQDGLSGGFSVRFERWDWGTQSQPYNSFTSPQFANAEAMLGDSTTTDRTLAMGLDGGLIFDLAQGVRLGLTGTQLNPKNLWGVDMKPQFRAGLQIDLGAQTQVALESDINSAERMPFPVKQQTASASVRYAINPAAVVLLGGEQKKIDGASVTRFGASLQIRTASLLLVFGFQAGQSDPMKSATVGFL